MWKLICYKSNQDKQGTLIQSFDDSIQAVGYMAKQANELSSRYVEWELKRELSIKERLS